MRQHTRFDKGMLFFNLDDAEKTANINSNPKHTHFPSMLYKMLDNECLNISNKIGAKSERERFQDTTTILRYFSETRDVSRVSSD